MWTSITAAYTLACITGAFWAKQGERGISRKPRGPHEPPSSRGLREMLRFKSNQIKNFISLRISKDWRFAHN